MTKQQVANVMLKDFPWDGTELATPLTLPGALLAPTYIEQKEIVKPANPPAGSLRLYAKSDGKYYQLDSAGNEMIISGMSQSQSDARYLQLTGGILSGPLSVNANLSAQNIVASGAVTSDSVVANTYKWNPASDGETLWKEMPGRLRLSGAQLTIDTNLNVGTFVQVGEIATPVTPNTGQIRLYGKTDHRVYIKVNSGAEASLLTATEADTHYDPLGIAASGDAAHVAATDPHPIYLTAAEGDVRYSANPGAPSGGYVTYLAGDARYLLQTGGTLTGNLLFSADNTKDIGASGATRPRTIYAGTSVVANSGSSQTTIGQSASAGAFLVGSSFGGVLLGSGGSSYVTLNATAVQPFSDNGKDLGSSGSRFKDLYLAHAIYVASVSERILYRAGTTGQPNVFVFESLDGQVTLSGKNTVTLSGNAWFDGTNWVRIDTSVPSGVINVTNAGMSYYTAPSGTGAPAWVPKFSVAADGAISNPVVTIAGVGVAGFIGNIRNQDFGIGTRTANFLRIGANSTIAFWANDGAFTNDSPQMSLSSAGALSVSGALSAGGAFSAASLSISGGSTLSGKLIILGPDGAGIGDAGGNYGSMEAQGAGGGAAKITFHRPGSYATYFGLDTDNQFAIGGWSMGAVRHILATVDQPQTFSSKTIDGTCTIADAVQHSGWVRVNGNVGIYSSTYGIGIQFINSVGPVFYSGTYTGEYIQSHSRWDMSLRYTTGGNITMDPATQDAVLFNTGSQIILPDLNACWGRVLFVKNILGTAASVYVSNGNGIYGGLNWVNPWTLQPGDCITVFACQAYSGWMII